MDHPTESSSCVHSAYTRHPGSHDLRGSPPDYVQRPGSLTTGFQTPCQPLYPKLLTYNNLLNLICNDLLINCIDCILYLYSTQYLLLLQGSKFYISDIPKRRDDHLSMYLRFFSLPLG